MRNQRQLLVQVQWRISLKSNYIFQTLEEEGDNMKCFKESGISQPLPLIIHFMQRRKENQGKRDTCVKRIQTILTLSTRTLKNITFQSTLFSEHIFFIHTMKNQDKCYSEIHQNPEKVY